MDFSKKQLTFLSELGISFHNCVSIDEETYDKIEAAVSQHLQMYGFDEEYNLTPIGKLCEEILDILSD